MRIGDVMDRDLTALTTDTTVAEAIEILSRHRVTGAPVVDEDGIVVGFLSEKDIVKAALPGYFEYIEDPSFIPDFGQLRSRLRKISRDGVERFMVKKVLSFQENDSDFFVAMTLIRNNLKRAPIISENGELVGIVNRADILEHIMRDDETGGEKRS